MIKPQRPLLMFISLTLLLGSVIAMQAAPPRSVGLLSFEATALANAIRLDWETATELQTAGFIVKRSVNGGAFISLPDIGVPGFVDAAGDPAGFVIAMGGPAEGGTYQEMDADVQVGSSYTYKLIEVENNNNEVELDTQSVVFGATPTNTATTQPLVTNTLAATAATSTLLPNSTALSTVITTTPTATATQAANSGAANVPVAAASTQPGPPTALPTVTPAAKPETVTESSVSGAVVLSSAPANNSVLAQVETTATAVPPTATGATTNGDDNSYPGFQPQPEPTQELGTPTPSLLEAVPTAYPVATQGAGEDAETTAVPIIGSQTNGQPGNGAANQTPSRSQLGRIYLWAGFLLSFLIFVMTVVATILLFMRKRAQ